MIHYLLQDDLLPRVESLGDLCLGTVADTRDHRDFAFARRAGRIGYLDRRGLILVIEDSAFRHGDDSLTLFQNDLRVGGHLGAQLAGFVGDRDAHFESSHIVFLHAHRGDLGHLALELLVLERFDGNARGLTQVDFADIALIHLAFDIHVGQVADGHDQRGPGTHRQNGTDSVAHLAVARQHHTVDGRNDGGIAQILFRLRQRRARLFDGRFRLGDGGLRHAQVHGSGPLPIHGHVVVLLRVVHQIAREQLLLIQVARAIHVALEEWDIGSGGVDFIALVIGLRALEVGFRQSEGGLKLAHLGQDVILVQLTNDLTFVYHIADVDGQALNDAAGFGFNFDFGLRLDLTCGHYRAGQVDLFRFDELFRVDLGRTAADGLEGE